MTATSLYLICSLLAAPSVSAEVSTLAGGRSAPESSLQLPHEAEEEIEPAALLAFIGNVEANTRLGLWFGGSIEGWGYAPESETTTFKGGAQVGWGHDLGEKGRLETAGRYAIEAIPGMRSASSGRGELLAWLGWDLLPHGLELSALGLDRRYPNANTLSFRSIESQGTWTWSPARHHYRLLLGAGVQGNQGWTPGSDEPSDSVFGWQTRVRGELGWSSDSFDFSIGYRLYVAEEGETEEVSRAQFTLIGDYADDADVLSAGGFIQHRADLALTYGFGDWTATFSALARFRTVESYEVKTGYSRTGHLHIGLKRSLTKSWTILGAAGFSSAEMLGGSGYTDLYGWIGVSRKIP